MARSSRALVSFFSSAPETVDEMRSRIEFNWSSEMTPPGLSGASSGSGSGSSGPEHPASARPGTITNAVPIWASLRRRSARFLRRSFSRRAVRLARNASTIPRMIRIAPITMSGIAHGVEAGFGHEIDSLPSTCVLPSELTTNAVRPGSSSQCMLSSESPDSTEVKRSASFTAGVSSSPSTFSVRSSVSLFTPVTLVCAAESTQASTFSLLARAIEMGPSCSTFRSAAPSYRFNTPGSITTTEPGSPRSAWATIWSSGAQIVFWATPIKPVIRPTTIRTPAKA